MTVYAKELRTHLTAYKEGRLGIRRDGEFTHKGKTLTYGHILPKELKWLNILEPFRLEIQVFLRANPALKLHKYFHHLNSSQALALNLFFPYFEGGPAETLLRALGQNGSISEWAPELIVDSREGTNIDVAWRGKESGKWTYCEVKLSEQDFGKAKPDKRHLDKLRQFYAPTLRQHVPPELLEPAPFFAHYQIFRNIWLAARDPGSAVLFLLPQKNTPLWAPLRTICAALVPEMQDKVQLVALEDCLAKLTDQSPASNRLEWYAGLLREKYVPDTQASKYDQSPA